MPAPVTTTIRLLLATLVESAARARRVVGFESISDIFNVVIILTMRSGVLGVSLDMAKGTWDALRGTRWRAGER